MRILVTAFDPFGGEAVNPAGEALALLPGSIGGAEICKLTVPTVFEEAGPLACREMDRLRPQAVVSLGQAGGRQAVTPERVAVNVLDARIPDNRGAQPVDCPVVPGGPAAYFSTLPVKAIVGRIRDGGLPGELSNSAGTFVCNSLMYHTLHHASQSLPGTLCGFIHVPYIPQQTEGKPGKFSLPLEDIARAVALAIEETVKALP